MTNKTWRGIATGFALFSFSLAHVPVGWAESWRAEWEKTLAAAKKEGVVAVNGSVGEKARRALAAEFQKAYPEITIEYIGRGGRDFQPAILAERRANKYLLDVTIGGSGTHARVKNAGVADPLRPALILPELQKDKTWLGGFEVGFYDKEKAYSYTFAVAKSFPVFVNRDVIPESKLNSIEGLLDPKWKGKIVWDRPHAFGSGIGSCSHFLMTLQEDFVRKLYKQDIVPTGDKRQFTEWIVTGRYPIGAGMNMDVLRTFQEQGLGLNVKPLAPASEPGWRISQQGALMLINRAPHPNAAKVYINWLLSREGQTPYASIMEVNSRRLDVTTGSKERLDPTTALKQIKRDVAAEPNLHFPRKCVKIGKELIR